MVKREIKDEMARVYMSHECPACGGKKIPLRWLCISCRGRTAETPANVLVTEYCERHMAAVQNLIAVAKT